MNYFLHFCFRCMEAMDLMTLMVVVIQRLLFPLTIANKQAHHPTWTWAHLQYLKWIRVATPSPAWTLVELNLRDKIVLLAKMCGSLHLCI